MLSEDYDNHESLLKVVSIRPWYDKFQIKCCQRTAKVMRMSGWLLAHDRDKESVGCKGITMINFE